MPKIWREPFCLNYTKFATTGEYIWAPSIPLVLKFSTAQDVAVKIIAFIDIKGRLPLRHRGTENRLRVLFYKYKSNDEFLEMIRRVPKAKLIFETYQVPTEVFIAEDLIEFINANKRMPKANHKSEGNFYARIAKYFDNPAFLEELKKSETSWQIFTADKKRRAEIAADFLITFIQKHSRIPSKQIGKERKLLERIIKHSDDDNFITKLKSDESSWKVWEQFKEENN